MPASTLSPFRKLRDHEVGVSTAQGPTLNSMRVVSPHQELVGREEDLSPLCVLQG